jgi:hypothetical protein
MNLANFLNKLYESKDIYIIVVNIFCNRLTIMVIEYI